ncbi:MAG: DUF3566 domain-containing protein [Candidatus Nanopelagicales bacterium]
MSGTQRTETSGSAGTPPSPAQPPLDPRVVRSAPLTRSAPQAGAPPMTAQATGATVRPTGPRRARLYVTRIDPWSVMKASFMLALSIAIVLGIAVAALWYVLDMTGVFDAVSRNVNEVVGGGTETFDMMQLVDFNRVMGVTLVIGSVEIVIVSMLATLFAFLYNLTVGITGGLEVTLSDDA